MSTGENSGNTFQKGTRSTAHMTCTFVVVDHTSHLDGAQHPVNEVSWTLKTELDDEIPPLKNPDFFF